MSTYKRVARGKKKANELPLYRPIDRMVLYLWDRRKKVAPFVILLFSFLLIYGGLRFYLSRYESSASRLLEKGENAEVVDRYPRSKAALIARIKLGGKALQDGFYDDAIRWYLPVTEKTDCPEILRIGALQNLAFAYLKKGEPDRAIEVLEGASRDPQNAASDYSSLLLARAYEGKGETGKASGIYKTLSEGAGASAIQQAAKERLTWLEGQEKK